MAIRDILCTCAVTTGGFRVPPRNEPCPFHGDKSERPTQQYQEPIQDFRERLAHWEAWWREQEKSRE